MPPRRRGTRTQAQVNELEDLNEDISRGNTPRPAGWLRDQEQRNREPSPQRNAGVIQVEELADRLANIQNTRPKFKAPKFNGTGDVELFINHFEDVMAGNRWRGREATIHLRTSLEDKAVECGRGTDTEEIFANLRARFGITPRQAKAQLKKLQMTPKQKFAEFGAEVTRLAKLTYPDQNRAFILDICLEVFIEGLPNANIRQFVSSKEPGSIHRAVEVCEEFLHLNNKVAVNFVELEEEDTEKPKPATTEPTETMKLLLATMEQMAQGQAALLERLTSQPAPKQKSTQEITCFECGGPHYKRRCPRLVQGRVQTQPAPFVPPQPISNQNYNYQAQFTPLPGNMGYPYPVQIPPTPPQVPPVANNPPQQPSYQSANYYQPLQNQPLEKNTQPALNSKRPAQ